MQARSRSTSDLRIDFDRNTGLVEFQILVRTWQSINRSYMEFGFDSKDMANPTTIRIEFPTSFCLSDHDWVCPAQIEFTQAPRNRECTQRKAPSKRVWICGRVRRSYRDQSRNHQQWSWEPSAAWYRRSIGGCLPVANGVNQIQWVADGYDGWEMVHL